MQVLIRGRQLLVEDLIRKDQAVEAAEVLQITRNFGLGTDAMCFRVILNSLVSSRNLKEAAELWSAVSDPEDPPAEDETLDKEQPGLWAEAALKDDASVLRTWIYSVAEACVESDPVFPEPDGLAGLRESARSAFERLRTNHKLGSQDFRAEIILTVADDPSTAFRLAKNARDAESMLPDNVMSEHGVLVPEIWEALVRSFCRKNDFEAARKVVDEAGPSEESVLRAFNALIAQLALEERFDDALSLAKAMRTQRFLIPDTETILALLSPYHGKLVGQVDPEDGEDIARAATLRAERVIAVFSQFVFDNTFAKRDEGSKSDQDLVFSIALTEQPDSSNATKDQGTDMPLDFVGNEWVVHHLLRAVAHVSGSAHLVDDAFRRVLELDLVGPPTSRLHGVHIESLLIAGAPGRAAGHLRKAYLANGLHPEAGRLATIWLALSEAGRLREADELLDFARTIGSDAMVNEVEVIEKHFVKQKV